MHYTSPAHPQEKKQEYQIDYLQRLVLLKFYQPNRRPSKSCLANLTWANGRVHSTQLPVNLKSLTISCAGPEAHGSRTATTKTCDCDSAGASSFKIAFMIEKDVDWRANSCQLVHSLKLPLLIYYASLCAVEHGSR